MHVLCLGEMTEMNETEKRRKSIPRLKEFRNLGQNLHIRYPYTNETLIEDLKNITYSSKTSLMRHTYQDTRSPIRLLL